MLAHLNAFLHLDNTIHNSKCKIFSVSTMDSIASLALKFVLLGQIVMTDKATFCIE